MCFENEKAKIQGTSQMRQDTKVEYTTILNEKVTCKNSFFRKSYMLEIQSGLSQTLLIVW